MEELSDPGSVPDELLGDLLALLLARAAATDGRPHPVESEVLDALDA